MTTCKAPLSAENFEASMKLPLAAKTIVEPGAKAILKWAHPVAAQSSVMRKPAAVQRCPHRPKQSQIVPIPSVTKITVGIAKLQQGLEEIEAHRPVMDRYTFARLHRGIREASRD